ncbi:MAG: ribonuclease Z [Nanoarchaeota archaeon]|nr:ribonuclease Z [Nanoarchaeota archaeon]
MTFKLHFLGTGCMIPTKERNHLSVALEYQGNIFLFDCGEATQLQIRKMKLPMGKIRKIFISHWHGDHVLGLSGLLMTLGNTQGIDLIEIHGPKGSKDYISHMRKSMVFDSKINLEVFEHNPKEGEVVKIMENMDYTISCAKLQHSVPCIAYSFKEKDSLNVDKKKAKRLGIEESPLLARVKLGLDIDVDGKKVSSSDITYVKEGLKVSLVFDTRPCQGVDNLVKDSDYLVMEATYIYETHGEKAEEYDHMSAKETAEVALQNGVKNLIITHFSQRYKDTKDIEAEAKEIFENTTSTYDLMTIKLR